MSRRGRATFPAVLIQAVRMKRSDIGVTALVYAFTLFFLYMTLELPPDAQTYPLCLITGLLAHKVFHISHEKAERKLPRRTGIRNDLPELFAGFQWGQFAFICLGCVVYMLLMHVAGFYVASICYLVGTLAFLRVPRWHIVLTVVVMAALIYAVFTLFLKVPLPVGLLFK